MGNNGGSKNIVFIRDVPEIIGDSGKSYGPFKKGDRIAIPSDARKAFDILLSSGYAKEAFNMVEAALYYRKLGLNPIPLMPKDKRPLMAWERFQNNLITEDEIREIWSKNPDANIGLVTGQVSGIVVVDIDGPDGVQNYKAMNKGKDIITPSVRTGKGHHYYFKHPKNILIKNKARIAKEIDIRGDGGYVVAPPSIHPSGRPYEWDAVTKNAEFADIPIWLYEILEEKVGKKNGSSLIEEGSRNNRLVSISGRLRNIGLGPEEVQVMLQAYNKQFTTNPLPENEVSKITTDFIDEGRPVTDMGNALRLKDYFGDDLLYCHSWGKWLIWDSTRWRIDDTGKIMSTAKEVARRILVESTIPRLKPDRVEKLAKWGASSQNRSRLEAMVALAQSEMPITPDLLDQDPWLFNVENKTINLKNCEVFEQCSENFITKKGNVVYDPDSECQLWLEFLDRIMEGDKERIDFMQKAVGYSLTGITVEQCFFFLHGSGANGKSTFLEVLADIFGDYHTQTDFNTFMEQKFQKASNDIARLKGARFVCATEVEEGRAFSEVVIKQLTGQDTISARYLYGEFFDFRPTHKIWIAGNHKPVIRGNDNAIWRRVKLIPFEYTIPEEERDKEMANKLRDELSGILNWAIEGCVKWQKEGLNAPHSVQDAVNKYRSDMDVLAEFIDEIVLTPASGKLDGLVCEAKIKVSELYDAYVRFCKATREKYVLSNKKFSMKMEEKGFEKKRENDGQYFLGINVDRAKLELYDPYQKEGY